MSPPIHHRAFSFLANEAKSNVSLT